MEIKDNGNNNYEIRYKCYKKLYIVDNPRPLDNKTIESRVLKFEHHEIDWSYLFSFNWLFKKKTKQEISEEKKISVELNLRNKGFVKDGSFYRKDFTCIDLSNNTIWHDGMSNVKSMSDLNDLDIFINNFSRI